MTIQPHEVVVVRVDLLSLQPGFYLSGEIVDAQGVLVAGPTHLALFEGGRQRRRGVSIALGEVVDGRFLRIGRVAVATDDTHILAVTPAGLGWAALASVAGVEADEIQVRVPVAAASSMSIVVRGAGQQPVVGARCTLTPEFYPLAAIRVGTDRSLNPVHQLATARFTAYTGDEGRARFERIPADPEHSYTLRVSAAGYSSYVRYRVAPDDATPFELELAAETESKRMLVVLQDDRGMRIEGATVACGDVEAIPHGRGEYLFESIRPLPESLIRAEANGYGTVLVPCTDPVSRAPRPTVVVVLSAGRTVHGHVRDVDGLGVPGASVAMRALDLPPACSVPHPSRQTGSQGEFHFDRVSYARQEIIVTGPKPEYAGTRSVTVAIESGEENVTVTLPARPVDDGCIELEYRVEDQVASSIPVAVYGTSGDLLYGGGGFDLGSERFVRRGGRIDACSLPSGRWRIWALSVDGKVGHIDCKLDVERTFRGELLAKSSGALEGLVVFEGGAAGPPEGVQVRAVMSEYPSLPGHGPWSVVSARTDAHVRHYSGHFVIDSLVAGRYDVTVAGGGWEARQIVEIPSGDTASVVLEARRRH